jgi:hypothetical protein
VDVTPLIHFWGIQPQNPKALAKAMKKEGLKPSKKIYDRLQHYKTIIPMDNAAFRKHAKIVYPKGVGKPQNPLFPEGWYERWLTSYDETHGQAVQDALQQIIDQYYPTGAGE